MRGQQANSRAIAIGAIRMSELHAIHPPLECVQIEEDVHWRDLHSQDAPAGKNSEVAIQNGLAHVHWLSVAQQSAGQE
jgi:hypothetical protein